MRLNRRNVLVGLGTIVAGGGAALGTGAFSTVEADRTLTVDTAGDGDALIALSSTSSYADTTGGTLEFDLTASNLDDGNGLNLDATTTLTDALTIENNSAKTIEISSQTTGDIDVSLVPGTTTLQPTTDDTDDTDVDTVDIEIDTTGANVSSGIDVTVTIVATVQ